MDRGMGRVARGCGKALAMTGLLVAGGLVAAILLAVVVLRGLDLDFGLGDGCRDADDQLIRDAARGDRAGVAEALRQGDDPDHVADGRSALECAAAAHEEDVVALLLDEGATPSRDALHAAVGSMGGTFDLPALPSARRDPGAAAADAEREEVVRLLLEHGADADGGPVGPSPLLRNVDG